MSEKTQLLQSHLANTKKHIIIMAYERASHMFFVKCSLKLYLA